MKFSISSHIHLVDLKMFSFKSLVLTLTCFITVSTAEKYVEERVLIQRLPDHRLLGSETKHSFSFHAFGKTHTLEMTRVPMPVVQHGYLGFPFLVVDDNGIHVQSIHTKNIEYYQDLNNGGAFTLEINKHSDFTINGIFLSGSDELSIMPSWPLREGNFLSPTHTIRKTPRSVSTTETTKRESFGFHNSAVDATDHDASKPFIFEISDDLRKGQATIFSKARDSENHPNHAGHISNSTTSEVINGTIETLVFTDLSFYKDVSKGKNNESDIHLSIVKYVAILVHAANLRYQYGIRDPTLSISMVLTGLVICKTQNCSSFTEDHRVNNTVDNYEASNAFAEMLNKTYDILSLHYKFDYAVALTRLDLTDRQGNPVGVSFTDDICLVREGLSSSVVEDQGAFSSVGTLVHELAHTLGSDHDGWGRSSACNGNDGFIMSSLSPLVKNGFFFSACSIKSMKENLNKSSADCIRYRSVTQSDYDNFVKDLPGQTFNRTAQCQQLYGTNFCLSVGTTLADICYKMFCWDPILPNVCSTKSPAAFGTSCGNKRWCVRGECVHDDNAP